MKKGILWPIGIIVFLVSFVSYLIGVAIMSKNTNIDIVSPNYYEDELKYQDEIDAQNNALAMQEKVLISQDDDQNLVIAFPNNIKRDQVRGLITLFRPDDSKADLAFPITLNSNNKHIVHRGLLKKGAYKLKVHWSLQNKDYLIKKQIFIKASM